MYYVVVGKWLATFSGRMLLDGYFPLSNCNQICLNDQNNVVFMCSKSSKYDILISLYIWPLGQKHFDFRPSKLWISMEQLCQRYRSHTGRNEGRRLCWQRKGRPGYLIRSNSANFLSNFRPTWKYQDFNSAVLVGSIDTQAPWPVPWGLQCVAKLVLWRYFPQPWHLQKVCIKI